MLVAGVVQQGKGALGRMSYSQQVGGKGTGTGILMLNLGGPASLPEVEPFLTRLLSDKEIVKLPLQHISGPLLAKRRAVKVRKQYEMIGGGSPIRKWTQTQGEGLCAILDQEHPSTAPHKPYIAFRYADPMTGEALKRMSEDGIERVVAFSQYPQYSCSTTGSSLNELYRNITKAPEYAKFKISVIDRWFSDGYLLKTFAGLIRESLEKLFEPEERGKVVLLFSAHSLPLSVVARGDAYPHEVASTVKGVMQELGYTNPHFVVWQSKVGPTPWLKPSTGDAIVGLAENGHKNQLLVPIAFTSDHIETLYEYDILYKELAEKKGIKLRRVPALNDNSQFINTLAHIVKDHLDQNPFKSSSVQLKMRCPQCVNPDCLKMKTHFTPLE